MEVKKTLALRRDLSMSKICVAVERGVCSEDDSIGFLCKTGGPWQELSGHFAQQDGVQKWGILQHAH